MKERITIGLLVANLNSSFERPVIAGVMDAAENKDVNLLTFVGRYLAPHFDDKEKTNYEYQFNTVFSYAKNTNVDVLIIMLGPICSRLEQKEVERFIKQYEDIPTVLVFGNYNDLPSVNIDNKSGFYAALDRIIKEKNCSNVCYVSGPKGNRDADERLEIYKQVLVDNNIEFSEDRVAYGDYTKYCYKEIEELIDRNTDIDAIAFVNDESAETGYEVLKDHGYKIGEDILAINFDSSFDSFLFDPPITSIDTDLHLIGEKAIEVALDYYYNKSVSHVLVESTPIYRQSTNDDEKENLWNLFGKLEDKELFNSRFINKIKNHLSSDVRMDYKSKRQVIAYFSEIYTKKDKKIDDIIRKITLINRNILMNDDEDSSYKDILEMLPSIGYKSSAIFVLNNPIRLEKCDDVLTYENPSNYIARVFNYDGIPTKTVNTPITIDKLFDNEYIPRNRRYSLIVNKIFIKDEILGVFISEPNQNVLKYHFSVASQIATSMKTINIIEEQKLMYNRLSDLFENSKEENKTLDIISKTDELTGLTNRRGLLDTVEKIKNDPMCENTESLIAIFDINYLKSINDEFGHAEGDVAIKTAARLLRETLRNNDIIARIGGDEFAAIIINRHQINVDNLYNRIKKVFDEYNDNANKPYDLEISAGFNKIIWNKDINFDNEAKVADSNMYLDKQTKKPFKKKL